MAHAATSRPIAAARLSACAPSTASSWSSSAEDAPLTPTAPTTSPSCVDRHAALQRHRARQVQRRGPPAGGLVLEVLARPAVDRRGARLVGRDARRWPPARRRAAQVHQLAAGVDDRDDGRDAARAATAPTASAATPRALVGERRDLGGRELGGGAGDARPPRPRRASRRSCRSRRRPRRRPSAGCRRSAPRRRAARARRAARSLTCCSISRLGRTKIAAVRALSTATRALATCAPGCGAARRARPDGSTTAITTRCACSRACRSAAAITASAPACR